MKSFFKIIIIYLLIFFVSLLKSNNLTLFIINTILLIILPIIFNLEKRLTFIFLSILAVFMLLFCFDIYYYYNYYIDIGYIKQLAIFSEIKFNILLILNIPLFKLFNLLKEFNALYLRFIIVPMYFLSLMGTYVYLRKLKVILKEKGM